jgi:Uma2 family endonuclease
MNDLSSGGDTVIAPALFTADEFEQLAMAGLDLRLELANGVLERMSPPGNHHSYNQTSALISLISVLGDTLARDLLRIEVGVRLANDTVRVPDLSYLRHPVGGKGLVAASDVLLAIEVAEDTQPRDLGIKPADYARAGIPIYWVVDGPARITHVHTEPTLDGYAQVRRVPFADPLPVPGTGRTITLA